MSTASVSVLSVHTELTILKPIQEVFAAALLPAPFFVAKASGPLAEGKTIHWTFAETPAPVTVTVEKVLTDELIRFQWGSALGGNNTCVFTFRRLETISAAKAEAQGIDSVNAVTISITESGWPENEKGRESSYGNQMGWTNFACSLKAWVEYGVNLRRGAFLHHKF